MGLFGDGCALIGMVHLLPLPGSPGYGGDVAAILARARGDAETLGRGGCDAVFVENMVDLERLRRVRASTGRATR